MNVHYSIRQAVADRFEKWRKPMDDLLSRWGRYTDAEHVLVQCMNMERLLFENGEAFAIVNVVDHPYEKWLFIQLAGGTAEGLDKLEPSIAQFGRTIGATKGAFIGRIGMRRMMAKRGWKERRVYMEKEIV